jgi:hypothetical protein
MIVEREIHHFKSTEARRCGLPRMVMIGKLSCRRLSKERKS